MIKKISGKLEKINLAEAARYLGYNAGAVRSAEEERLFCECESEALSAQNLLACYDCFPVEVCGNTVNLGFVKVESRSLAKNLASCNRAVVFASTAGAGIDRLIAKYARISPAKAAVMQAVGAALAEDWCDEICKILGGEYGRLKPRFSCGYGDLPLTMQQDIFGALAVEKHIGVTLSENLFMTPTKSVTAIVGIAEDTNDL